MPPLAADLAEPPQSPASAVARVWFFGRLADVFGRVMSVTMPYGGCSVSDLKAGDDPWVSLGQEVAFLPALSGG